MSDCCKTTDNDSNNEPKTNLTKGSSSKSFLDKLLSPFKTELKAPQKPKQPQTPPKQSTGCC